MNQNNAPQTVLTDEEILAVWVEHGLDDEAVEDFARAIESVLLSKLRAPVAGERVALQNLVDLEDMRLRLRALHESGHGIDYDYYHKALPAAWEAARAALKKAPVAGDDDIPDFSPGNGNKARRRAAALQSQRQASAPAVDERRCEYCDGTGDVHSIAGEWRGNCICPDGRALASAPVAGEAQENLAPPKCPITGRPFFMALEHQELGMVPTYGGPYDSYTIPHLDGKPDQPWHERELRVYRYDHDLGGWITDETEVIPLRIVHEDVLHELQDAASQASEAVRANEREPSPTAGMNLGQRIAHVGGRTNAQGYIEFGSPMAVNALIRQVLRDLPGHQRRAAEFADRRARIEADMARGSRLTGHRLRLDEQRARDAGMRKALADLLAYVDRNTCTHENTHRGGAIWTICDDCGKKWADDEGGFKPHQDAPAVAAARAALSAQPGAQKEQP